MLHDVAGIVLAAGRSARMGRSKPLLEIGGETFVARAVRSLREGGCAPVLVVMPAGDGAVAGAAREAGALVVDNPDPASEQIDSVRRGLEGVPATAGAAAVLPVDHPLVRPATVATLVARWREEPRRIVRPVHDGRPGHPTVFPRPAWEALRGDLPRGARSVVEDPAHPCEDVAVEDPGVVADIDTPEAYARLTEGP